MDRKAAVIATATLLTACILSGCGLPKFGKNEPEDVIVETPTPVPTIANTPTPTPSPNLVDGVYTSSDHSITIRLPDRGWKVRTDEENIQSFESRKKGGILILHGKGEDAMNKVVIPNTRDLAASMETASNMVEGTDFEITNFTTTSIGSVDVYSYAVHYLDTSKSEGYPYAIYRYFVTPNEYYSITGNVKTDDNFDRIMRSINSFKVMSSSAISSAATGEPIEQEGAAIASAQSSTDYTDEQLSDTGSTRTIYRNSDAEPVVIVPDGNGGWTDSFGNSYRFENDEDVYDQNDEDYWWGGEAGDVAFMPRESDQ